MTDHEPQGSRRSERRIFGRETRSRPRRGQQYIFVGLAILFLFGWITFRKGCADRIGRTFGAVTDPATRDAGINSMRPRTPPMRPKNSDPDDW
jgi:hypothetical protein